MPVFGTFSPTFDAIVAEIETAYPTYSVYTRTANIQDEERAIQVFITSDDQLEDPFEDGSHKRKATVGIFLKTDDPSWLTTLDGILQIVTRDRYFSGVQMKQEFDTEDRADNRFAYAYCFVSLEYQTEV